jgi:hypothetical protein
MGAVLSQNPGGVNLRWIDGDPEAQFLAVQLSQIFGRAKWQVGAGGVKPSNGILFGIVMPPASGVDADAIREALAAGKIRYSAVPVSQTGIHFNVSNVPNAPFLMVGSRLPVALANLTTK